MGWDHMSTDQHLVLDGDGVAVECAVVVAQLEDVPRDLPRRGLHVGAAYAFEVVAELPEVHAIDHLIRPRPLLREILGVNNACAHGSTRRQHARTDARRGGHLSGKARARVWSGTHRATARDGGGGGEERQGRRCSAGGRRRRTRARGGRSR